MWARVALRRAIGLARTASVKSIDIKPVFSTNYPAPISGFNLIPVRYKTKPRKKKPTNTDDGDESESDDEDAGGDGENPLLMNDPLSDVNDGSKKLLLDLNSLRLDVVVKNAFGISRLKAEEALLKGDVYVNGEVPYKKSQDIYQNDEIDLILRLNAEDPTMVDIKRLHILELPEKSDSNGRLKVSAVLHKDLTIKSPKQD